MKRYTIKNLPPSIHKETEDIRLTFAKSRSTFLWCAFKDLLLNETLPMRIIIAILVIGAIGLVALDRPEKSITCLIVLLIFPTVALQTPLCNEIRLQLDEFIFR